MNTPPAPHATALDYAAATRWPARAASHILGAGLLLAVVIALPVAPTDLDRHQLPKETIVHLATWLAVLLARPALLRGLRPAARWSLIALAVIVVASGAVAGNGWLALRTGSLIITAITAFSTARQLAAAGNGPILLAWCVAAAMIGVTGGLAQAYGVQSPLFATTRIPGGTFGNRNFMAHFAGIALPLLVLVGLTTRRAAVAIGTTIGVAALAAAIILTRSRAAWIGAGLGMGMFALLCWRARQRGAIDSLGARARMMAITTAIGVAAAVVAPNQLAWRSSSPYTDTLAGLARSDEGSGHGRVLQYQHTLHLALRHPWLGVGPGNWPVRYGEVAPSSDPTWVLADVIPINPWPSSDWMALLSEIGFAGVLVALLFGASLLWRGWTAANGSGERMLAGAALCAVLATTFIEGNLDAVLLLPASMLLVALAAGVLVEQSDPGIDAANAAPHSSRATLLLALVIGIIALRSALQTAAYLIAGNGKVISRIEWAARVDPGSYPLRIALAQRLSCVEARGDVIAVTHLAPTWPATIAVARRCGVRIEKR